MVATRVYSAYRLPMTRPRSHRLYQLIGDRVFQARRALELSQSEVARQVGINRVSIVNIEKGRQRAPVDLLWRIAEVLGIELAQLIPRNADFDNADEGIQLSADDLSAIHKATMGDVAATRQLQEFVQRAKSRQLDSSK